MDGPQDNPPPVDAKPGMFCSQCHYALVGLTVYRCPECGQEFNPRDRTTYLDDTSLSRRVGYEFNKWVASLFIGLWILGWVGIWFIPVHQSGRRSPDPDPITAIGVFAAMALWRVALIWLGSLLLYVQALVDMFFWVAACMVAALVIALVEIAVLLLTDQIDRDGAWVYLVVNAIIGLLVGYIRFRREWS